MKNPNTPKDDYLFLSQIASQNELDLREYAIKVKDELKKIEDECVSDFVTLNPDVATLYHELKEKIENIVSHFQNELTEISSQVSILQERSQKMSTSLKNRKDLEKELHTYLQSILIPPSLIQEVCFNEIDGEYIEKVKKVDEIFKNLKNEELAYSDALKEIKPEMEKLRFKISSRLRNFLISKINILKKPKTNIQILQQNVLTKFKYFLSFLFRHSQETFVEMTDIYSNIMCKIYLNSFKIYIYETTKLLDIRMGKNDLIVVDESGFKASITAARGTNTAGGRTGAFSFEEREIILDEVETEPIIPHISQQKNLKYPLEELFRSQNCLLMNTVTTEFVFILEFFDLKMSQCNHIINTVFPKTVSQCLEWLTNITTNSHDIYAILLMTHINEQNKKIMERRRIPILDYYFDKFANVFDAQLNCIKRANPKVLKPNNLGIHYITIRYMDFAKGLYKISGKSTQEMLIMRLSQLRNSMLELLKKLSMEFQSEKEANVFQINNIDYILHALKSLQINNIDDLVTLDKDLNHKIEKLIRLLLEEHFGSMFEVVGKYGPSGSSYETESNESGEEVKTTNETHQQQMEADTIKNLDLKHLEHILNEFSRWYRGKLEDILKALKVYFGESENMLKVMKRLFKEIIMMYTTLLEITKAASPNMYRDLGNAPHILYELKNMSLKFSTN